MAVSEGKLSTWASRPSQAETDRMSHAETAIKKAIAACDKLASKSIKVFAQGSYRNRVNVGGDSDVDIAVVCSDTIFFDGVSEDVVDSFGYTNATYDFSDFRNDVGNALTNYFGSGVVTPGDKAFDVQANTYRVEADVAPFFVHRRFTPSGEYDEGVQMRTRSGAKIINWPDQHYKNAVSKNDDTGKSFKGNVRILKALRYRMIEEGIASASSASSFLMECLIWNVPNDHMNYDNWMDDLQNCLAFLYNNTRSDTDCGHWGEVSELKDLFGQGQPWTRQSAHQFISDCWDYCDFES